MEMLDTFADRALASSTCGVLAFRFFAIEVDISPVFLD